MFKPVIGCTVWFYPDQELASSNFTSPTYGPYAAIVTHVHDDTTVNALVFDSVGMFHSYLNIPLVQPGTDRPTGDHAAWMPHQISQARQAVLTEADAAADLAGTPRPDHPTA